MSANQRSAKPLARAAIGGTAVVVSLFIHPALAVAVGALALVWTLIGVAAVVSDVANAPETPTRPAPVKLAEPRANPIECPKCSLFIARDMSGCTCGYEVPTDATDRFA